MKNKRNKGITLIALVVTIIVLLILAGISIMMLSGNNGILNRAGEAKEKTVTKNLKEEVEMIISERQINKSIGQENKTVKEDIEKGISGTTIEEIEGYTDVFYVKKDNGYVTVYEDEEIQEGKAEIWDGEKILCPEFKKENNIWNWYIYKPSQLKFLADFVNTGDGQNLPEGLTKYVTEAGYKPEDVTMSVDTKINLMNNLDMGARQVNGEPTVGGSWTPIGTNFNNVKDKLGTFEGNDNCIKGVYVKTNTNYNGIFGYSRTIQNLTIKDSYIEGEEYTGGITGVMIGEKLEKCHNKNTKIKTSSIGGGITGFSQGIINYCSNDGEIEAIGTEGDACVGGIAGSVWAQSEDMSINNCINNGKVEGIGKYIGGITGRLQFGFSIIKCNNNGIVNGKNDYVGGIVGITNGSRRISECENNASITGKKYVGGLIGYSNYRDVISNCTNRGIITGKQDIGGICGGNGQITITNCTDTGKTIISDN